MNSKPTHDDIPAEIDFSSGVRGLHHIPRTAKVFVPASIEREVWEYFSEKAEQRGVQLPKDSIHIDSLHELQRTAELRPGSHWASDVC